jgi:hypothetical protein
VIAGIARNELRFFVIDLMRLVLLTTRSHHGHKSAPRQKRSFRDVVAARGLPGVTAQRPYRRCVVICPDTSKVNEVGRLLRLLPARARQPPVADAVFVGDALTTRDVVTGRAGPRPTPFTDDPAQTLASLARLADLRAAWVLPGRRPRRHPSVSFRRACAPRLGVSSGRGHDDGSTAGQVCSTADLSTGKAAT